MKIAHWLILLRENEGHGGALDENGCFTERKCVLRCDRYGSRGHFLFENQSLIDFQIGNERKREFRAAEMRFYLHKEFRAAGIRFLSTQRIGGGDLEENGHFLLRKRVAQCCFLNCHSRSENRSLVDFEIGIERKRYKIAYITR